MLKVLTYLIMIFPLFGYGQSQKKISVLLHVQPEVTIHKSNYCYRWRDAYTKVSFSFGGGAAVQYNFNSGLFVDVGIGYIPRRLQTRVFFNQGAIPPPRQSQTQELVIPGLVSLRTINFPLNIGYRFRKKENTNWFIHLGLTGNYLLNTNYGLRGKYGGSYKKNHWQGISIMIGAGADQKILKNLVLTGKVGFSVINTMKADEYLFSQDEYVISLPHRYLSLSAGVRWLFFSKK